MSAFEVLSLVLAALWLALLTVVVLVLVRQVAIMSYRSERAGNMIIASADGLMIGSDIPTEVLQAVPEAGEGVVYVLLTSGTCAPCHELVPRLAEVRIEEPVVALLPGGTKAADELATRFPSWIRVVRDPAATNLASGLRLQMTPFALELESGQVTGKAYLRNARDLLRLVEARHRGTRRLARKPLEVTANGG